MTSKIIIPKISKANKMSAFKELVGKKMEKDVTFMGVKVKISKLSVSEVLEIQSKAKAIENDDNAGFDLIKYVIKAAISDAKDLSDEDFNAFPMDELSKLSNEIMQFSGLSGDKGK